MTEGAPDAGLVASRTTAGRDIVGQIVLRAVNLALGVGVTLLLVRTLGTDGFGRWSVLLAVFGFVSYFGSLGLAQVTVERAAADPDRAPHWFGALVTLRLALVGPVTLLSLGVCLAVADDTPMRVAAVLVCAVLPVSVVSALSVVFQLQVRNVVVTAIEVGNGLLWAAAVVVVALLGGELVAFAAAFLAVSIVTNTAYIVLALRASPVHFRRSRSLWADLLRQGLPVGIGGLLTLGYGYIDQVIVFEIAGVRDAGLYGAVYRIYERIQFLPAAIMTTLFPLFVAARDADPGPRPAPLPHRHGLPDAHLPAGADDHARGPRVDHPAAVRRRLRRRRSGPAAADGHIRRRFARLPHRLPDRRVQPAAQVPR